MTSVYQHKLPIGPTLSAAYREWRRILPALRPLVINAFLIVLAISALDQFVPARLADQEFFGTAITLARGGDARISADADFRRHPSFRHS
jgi:hypothetical protein